MSSTGSDYPPCRSTVSYHLTGNSIYSDRPANSPDTEAWKIFRAPTRKSCPASEDGPHAKWDRVVLYARPPQRSRDPSPPVSTLQYVRGDTDNRFSPFPTPARPGPPPEPPLHPAWRDTSLGNGNQTRTGGAAMTPAIPPSRTHTSKDCSLTLCINSGAQRYPPTTFGVLEIKREQTGRKTTDHEIFMVFREIYYGKLRPPSQRLLSFRALKHIVFVEFTNAEQPTPLVMDAKLRRDIIHVFKKPHLISTDDTWMNWICDLGEDTYHDYGVLFVDDWDRQKIAVLVGVPWIISVVTAIVWIAGTGDIANAMAVSSYIMSATGVVVGLLAVLSAVEA